MLEPEKNNQPLEEESPPNGTTETPGPSPPESEGSVLGDMLGALGFSSKKKKGPKRNKSDPPLEEPVEEDAPEDTSSDDGEENVPDADDDDDGSSEEGVPKPPPHEWVLDPDDLLNVHGGMMVETFATADDFFAPRTSGDDELEEPEEEDQKYGDDASDDFEQEPEEETLPAIREKPNMPKKPSKWNSRAGRRKMRRVSIIASCIILAISAGIYLYPILSEPWPPSENVVASYADKTVTVEDLQNFIQLEGMKERDHMICEVHGFDHSKCDQFEECEQHPIDSLPGYRQMTTMLVMEEIIQAWADDKGITQREEVQHGLSDLLNDANVSQFMDQIHENEITPESIPKWEVQQYYDDNRDKYDGKAFSEVENEIRQMLVQQKDEEYFPAYIEELKKSAGLEVNFDLLKITEPTADEIAAYYQTNIKDYQSEASAVIQEIRMAAPDTATEATKQLGAGESFENVAASFSDTGKADEFTVVKGSRDATFEEAVWKLQPNEISKALSNSDGTTSIVRLVRLNDAGARPLADVTEEVKSILSLENMEREYSVNKTEALFSIDGKRYTLGDFYTEFKELSPEYQQMFATFEAKKLLLEQYITKELLLEESTDTTMTDREQHDMEDLRVQYFSQILHQEEIDGQIEDPTDEEVEKFYNENTEMLVSPPSAKISLIWLSQGLQGETKDQALQRANEALTAIRGGTAFAEVAKTYSEDYTKTNGGLIDEWLHEEQMPAEVGKAVFALAPGGVSEVIDSMGGYYIVQLNEKRDAVQNTLDESSEAIRVYLKDLKHAELEKGMEDSLLERANLVIYDRTLRRMLQQQGAASK